MVDSSASRLETREAGKGQAERKVLEQASDVDETMGNCQDAVWNKRPWGNTYRVATRVRTPASSFSTSDRSVSRALSRPGSRLLTMLSALVSPRRETAWVTDYNRC
jgi:hypothetical protein